MNFSFIGGQILDALFPLETDEAEQAVVKAEQEQQQQQQEEEEEEEEVKQASHSGLPADSPVDDPEGSQGDAGQDEDALDALSRGFWSTVGLVNSAGKSFVEAVRDDLKEFRVSLASETQALLAEKKKQLEERERRQALAAAAAAADPSPKDDSPAAASNSLSAPPPPRQDVIESLKQLQDSFWCSTLSTLPELLGLDLDAPVAASTATGQSRAGVVAAPPPGNAAVSAGSTAADNQRRLQQTAERLGLLLRLMGYPGHPAPSSTFALHFHQMLGRPQTYSPPAAAETGGDEQEAAAFLRMIEQHESGWLEFLRSAAEAGPDLLAAIAEQDADGQGLPEEQRAAAGSLDFVSRALLLNRAHYLGLFPAVAQALSLMRPKPGFRESAFWMSFIFRLQGLWQLECRRMRVLAGADGDLHPAAGEVVATPAVAGSGSAAGFHASPAKETRMSSAAASQGPAAGASPGESLRTTHARTARSPMPRSGTAAAATVAATPSKLISWSSDDDDDDAPISEEFELVSPSPAHKAPLSRSSLGSASYSRQATPRVGADASVRTPVALGGSQVNLSWSDSDDE